jgi:hypothetical protein
VNEVLQKIIDDLLGDEIAEHFAGARRYWQIAPLDVDLGFILQNPDASVEVWVRDEPPRPAASVVDGCQYLRERFLALPGSPNFTRLDLTHG